MMDYHIHPSYSADAEGTLEEFCRAALESGLREICFTTHLDTDPKRDDSYVIINGMRVDVYDSGWFEDYEYHVRKMNDIYSPQGLNVRLGVEVDLYLGVIEDLPEAFHTTKFDMVIGSVHLIDHKAISVKEEAYAIFKEYGLEKMGDIYYILIIESLKTGLFDILGHIDIYRRYGEEFFGPGIHSLWEPHIDELCSIMKSKGVGYEVNTSSLRRGLREPMPEKIIVEAMLERGVQNITVGSDAHKPSEVGGKINEAFTLLQNTGINEVSLFSERRIRKVAIDSLK